MYVNIHLINCLD